MCNPTKKIYLHDQILLLKKIIAIGESWLYAKGDKTQRKDIEEMTLYLFNRKPNLTTEEKEAWVWQELSRKKSTAKRFMRLIERKKQTLVDSHKKYTLTNHLIHVNGHTLHQIQALKAFSDVEAGELGGYIEKEENLSQQGDCWVYQEGLIYGNAQLFGDIKVFEAQISGDVQITGKAVFEGLTYID